MDLQTCVFVRCLMPLFLLAPCNSMHMALDLQHASDVHDRTCIGLALLHQLASLPCDRPQWVYSTNDQIRTGAAGAGTHAADRSKMISASKRCNLTGSQPNSANWQPITTQHLRANPGEEASQWHAGLSQRMHSSRLFLIYTRHSITVDQSKPVLETCQCPVESLSAVCRCT